MEIKVSSKSNPKSVAGMIFAMVKDKKETIIATIGAGALNQAIKAIIIANGFLAPLGIRVNVDPYFFQTEVDEQDISAIKLKLIVEE